MSSSKRKHERTRKMLMRARRIATRGNADAKRIAELDARWREYLEQIRSQHRHICELEKELRATQANRDKWQDATRKLQEISDRQIARVTDLEILVTGLRAKLIGKDMGIEALAEELRVLKKSDKDSKKLRRRLHTATARLETTKHKLNKTTAALGAREW